MRTIHYVGFKDDRYTNAYKVFGGPAMIHRRWDRRARRDIDYENDVVVFANGDDSQPVKDQSGNDLDEEYLI